MRRLAAAIAAAIAAAVALPVVPAHAGTPPTTTWVVERTSSRARTLTIRGGAGAGEHEWAMAAVVAATVGADGRFRGAEGGLFFGATAEDAKVTGPDGVTHCKDLPVPGGVCMSDFGAAIGFAIWWDEITFNRAFVVLRGRDASIDLGDHGSPGWRIRRWTGPVRVVGDVDDAAVEGPLGAGAGGFTKAEAVGGPGGSVAIGHPPCRSLGYTGAGSGAVRLLGGVQDAVATCADWAPPAAYKPGSTEWSFTGAIAGVSDVPARLVVIERPLR
jgi:hypothetical protein